MTSSYGIIYAIDSKMILRIIADAPDLSLHVGPGEALLTVEQSTVPTIFEAQALLDEAAPS